MTNAATSALRLLPGPQPFERAVEAFGRRLAAEGRSSSTISAYLRDLRRLSAVLLQRRGVALVTAFFPLRHGRADSQGITTAE